MKNKKLVSIALLVFVVLISTYSISLVLSLQNPIISITPETQTFYTTTFNVNSTVTNATNVYAWQVRVEFNSTILNCTYVKTPDDSIFKLEQLSGIYIDNDLGYVMTGYSRLGDVPGKNGSGVLTVITFKIKAIVEEGDSLPFNLTYHTTLTYLLNPDMEEMPVNLVGGQYTFINDTTPPTIGTPTQDPPKENVQENQDVKVSVNVTDTASGVKNVTLSYTTNNQTWNNLPMELVNETFGLYEVNITGRPIGTFVKYNITAYDYAENRADKESYTYIVIPEFTLTALILMFMTITLVAVAISKRRFKVKVKQ